MRSGYLYIIFFCFAFTVFKGQSDSITRRTSWEKTKKNSKELIALLTNPLDLQALKKLKTGRSNSGSASVRDYFYKPGEKGFFYFYFVFPPFETHGPRITVYQKGNEIGGYMDTAEVFIQIACDRKDKDLGKLDLVGLSIPELVKKFGNNYLHDDTTIVYQHNSVLLILNGIARVAWFKVVRLNKPFKDLETIKGAKGLLSYY